MKINHLGGGLALILASALCASTPGLAAQTRDSAPQQSPQQQTQPQSPAQQAEQQAQQQQAQPSNQTFTGKIVKLTSGKFALLTGQTSDGKPAGHFLDDQDNAAKYEGKQVTVTGTFDEASNTIHVTNIQAA